MPQAAGGLGAAYAGGRVVAIGGEGTTAASDVVQAYDIRDESWSRLPALPRARHGVAVAAIGDSVYAVVDCAGRCSLLRATRMTLSPTEPRHNQNTA